MTPSTPLSTPFRLRDRLVTPARNSIQGPIEGPGGETGIEPKIMAVLCVLAAEPGRVFTRAELIDLVWGAEFGADESLTRAISHLRKALGDTRNEPLVIETIAKRGYRLLPDALSPATASPLPGTAPASADAPHSPSRRSWVIGMAAVVTAAGAVFWLKPFSREADSISITVMPVNAIRKEPSQLSLANALAVDLVGALAKERRLHVTVRRPDPGQPKQGRRVYTYIDLQTVGSQLKANVELMDVDTDQALWSRLYERAYDGKLSSQDALAAAIAKDITAALLEMARPKP